MGDIILIAQLAKAVLELAKTMVELWEQSHVRAVSLRKKLERRKH